MHLGDPAEALRLVAAGSARLEAELAPGEPTLHQSVLRHNRAQLSAQMGTPEEGVAAYTAVIASDLNHNEYYFERAPLLRRLGRYDAALADCDAAIRTGPPYPEPYYNRGDLRAELGDIDGALADFDYILEPDPDVLDAYVNRAALRYEQGDAAGAAADVAEGLARDPHQPHLLCLRGLLALDEARSDDARTAFQAALRSEEIGFVFRFHHLLEAFTCLENALMPIIRQGVETEEQRARVIGLLHRVGLGHHLHKRPDEMSGGQNQCGALVRALANAPKIVLADAPTGNLDSCSGAEVFALMREMNRGSGVTFVMITHDERLAQAADRILLIEDGVLRELEKKR
jgi:ABC-type lipoprotein export system ATPase subunit